MIAPLLFQASPNTLSKALAGRTAGRLGMVPSSPTCHRFKTQEPKHKQTLPSCKSGLYPIGLQKNSTFDIRNLFLRRGGGELLGRKVLPNSCRSDFFLLCHLRTFVQVWMSTTLQRGFWWGFGTCWDTNMLYMYTTIYNYVTCNACIHLRLYEMYNMYIYIYLPAEVIRLRPNSSSKFTQKALCQKTWRFRRH